jgi:radical SAM superfamily enzyme YgiQ (UPF0313 family)
MRVLLVSTYDLGRQPFGLASPAAWLAERGFEVSCLDLAVQAIDEEAVRAADAIAFHLPMHTATRLAAHLLPRMRALAPRARWCAYGLYAAMNESYLRRLGVEAVAGGEFEASLCAILEGWRAERGGVSSTRVGEASPHVTTPVSLERLAFRIPDRRGLPALSHYAHLHHGGDLLAVGYTEASRGCKHTCRHCPVVPVYGGRFRIVPADVVLADVRAQVEAGARPVTFGDPDFWNGIGHAIPIVERLHREHPGLTYDATIKIEHLLGHREHLATLARTGCLFVTSAVESLDDAVLARLDKGHTRADFVEALARCRAAGVTMQPTFLPFTPWTTRAGYRELLVSLAELDLVENVAPIQLAIRLLIPAGSRLLELDEIARLVDPFDEEALIHPWRHAEPEVDALQRAIEARVREAGARRERRNRTFGALWALAHGESEARALPGAALDEARAPVPFLTEPWYC